MAKPSKTVKAIVALLEELDEERLKLLLEVGKQFASAEEEEEEDEDGDEEDEEEEEEDEGDEEDEDGDEEEEEEEEEEEDEDGDEEDEEEEEEDEEEETWVAESISTITEELTKRGIDKEMVTAFLKKKKADKDKTKKKEVLGAALDVGDRCESTLKKLETLAKKNKVEINFGKGGGRLKEENKVVRLATRLAVSGVKVS